MKNFYYLLENIALSANEAEQFFDLNRQEGTHDSPYPHLNNHQRTRPDGQAVLFEGDFPLVNQGRMVSLLAQVHSGNTRVSPNPQNAYGDEWVIQTQPPGSTNLCRFIVFGGLSADWEESHAAVLQYLADNAWEEQF